jgi:hypothetical protein
MNTTELFLIAMLIIFTVPYLVWRPGAHRVLGAAGGGADHHPASCSAPACWARRCPATTSFVFTPAVISAQRRGLVGGDAVRVDRRHRARPAQAWRTGAKAASPPAWRWACRCCWAARRGGGHAGHQGWMGPQAHDLAVRAGRRHGLRGHGAADPDPADGKAGDILRQPLGQRILRYASLDDIAIWGVLALILLDWQRVGRQAAFLLAFRARRGPSAG